MFWKKPAPQRQEPARPEPVAPAPMNAAKKLDEAASRLAASLTAYADASYRAALPDPDAELKAAYDKLSAARKLVTEGRLAFALGRCLPEHVKYWPSWIKREGFQNNVGFAASEITATEAEEDDGLRNISVKTIDFTFKDTPYRLILRDRGMSYAPGDPTRLGEVELLASDERVAKFEIQEDISKEYSEWTFSEVRALKVGPWMQDVIDISSQIEASRKRRMDSFHDDRAREAAKEIDLG